MALSQRLPLQGFALVGALCVAAVLRLHGMGAVLNHDEVYTYQVFASQPYGEIFTSYSVPNNHMLHSLLVRLSTQACGSGEWAIRWPALLAGLLAIPAIYYLCRALFANTSVAPVAAWLLALTPVHIEYSHAARGYSLLILLSILAFLGLWHALHGRALWWPVFALAACLATYTLPSAGVHILTLGLWAAIACFYRRDWKRLGLAVISGAIIALLVGLVYGPIREEVMRAAERWGVAVGGDPLAMLKVLRHTAVLCTGGLAGVFPALLAFVGSIALGRRRKDLILYIVLAWSIPFAAGLLVGTAGQPRTYLFLLLPSILAAAYGAVEGIGIKRFKTFAIPLLLAAYAWVGTTALLRTPGEDLRMIGGVLKRENRPGDLIVAPAILDRQILYYAGGAVEEGLLGIVSGQALERLLFATREADPRFTLDNYLLGTNLVTDDIQDTLEFPASSFTELTASGAMRLHRLTATGRNIFPAGPGNWQIFFLDRAGAVDLKAADPWLNQKPSLQIENPSGIKFFLQSTERFTADRDGIVVLVYARTEAIRTRASLYEVASGDSGETIPLQMLRTSSDPVRLRGHDGRLWHLEAYLKPVCEGTSYGVYIVTWDVQRQYVGNFSYYFFPYAQ